MALEQNSKTTLGATSTAGRAREADFKSRVKKFFPDIQRIDFSYSDIEFNHQQSEKLKGEGCFGYHHKESIIIDGSPVNIAWLPHIKDMSPSYIEMIVERVVDAERKAKAKEELEVNDVKHRDTSFASLIDS